MKFLVLTDLHQKASNIGRINRIIKSRNPDFTIMLGDITDMGTGEDAAELVKMIESEVYAIPGNCDSRDMPEKIGSAAHDMHMKSVKVGGFRLVGLGGSNITIFDTPFELTENEIYNALKPISKEGMILMTHAPSYGIFDKIPSGLSVGSPSIKKIVEEFRPIVALSGHIHEDRGAVTIDGTLFCNPGPARDGYAAIITIEDGVASAELITPTDRFCLTKS